MGEERPIRFHLLKMDELGYEVSIRDAVPEDTIGRLRSQIKSLASKLPSDEIATFEGNISAELRTIAIKIAELTDLCTKKPLLLKSLNRINALGNHLYHRLSRVCPTLEDDIQLKLNLDGQLDEITRRIDRMFSTFRSSIGENKFEIASGSPVEPTSGVKAEGVASVVYCERQANVNGLNLRFDGHGSVQAFIQRVEELCEARGISHQKLFNSAGELFSHDALFWYRGVREDVNSWRELRALLLEEFLPFDYNERLMAEIRSRTQGPDENIIQYLSIMKNYFERLSEPLDEDDQLKIVRNNLRPFYTTQLALVDIRDWQELKDNCRKLELAQWRTYHFQEPPACTQYTVAADLACNRKISRASSVPTKSSSHCPRCKGTDHAPDDCKAAPRFRCYRCGADGVTIRNCPRCNNRDNDDQSKKLVSPNRACHAGSVSSVVPDPLIFGNLSDPQPSFSKIITLGSSNSKPYLKVSIYSHKCSGLLDSGSAISIIGGNACRRFTDFVTISPSEDLKFVVTANGSRSPVTGCVSLPVTVKTRTEIIRFYVVPGVTTEFIFGINFWRAFKIAPDILSLLEEEISENDPVVAEVRYLHPFEELSPSQRAIADDVLRRYEDVSFERRGLGCTSLITHHIDTGNSPPIKQRYYRLSPERLKELNRQVDEMLEMDVIERSNSPWNNPVTLAPKSNGEMRFCLDSRKLNAVSKHDAYPLPYIHNILDQLRDARYLSSIDLKAAFWQIKLSDSSKEKTAFTIPSRGLFHFKRMCFGLTSAPATQQRLMDLIFGPEFDGRIFIYLDDIVAISRTFEDHIELLLKILDRLKSANLSINLEKCCFFRRQLKYLGYVVDEEGLRTDPGKIKSIIEFPIPTCRKDVKRFLGTASYYRRFIQGFSHIAAPLNALTSIRKKASEFVWSPEADRAFTDLKIALTTAPVLACPDFTQPFIVHTDASEYGVGGMLTQVIDNEEHPVAYCSRSLTRQERGYSATEREALAVVYSVEYFRPYIEGSRPFRVITDHSSLKWFFNLKNPTGRLERWGCRLSPYNFTVEHRKGKENVVPDALSRSVPVATLSVADAVGDPWYNNIFSRCLNKPQTCPNFQIINGTLYRYTKGKFSLTSDFDWKEVVPSESRASLILQHHDSARGAHLGIDKTYKRLRLNYFWPGMFADVSKYITDCDTCKAYKYSNQPPSGLMGNPKVCRRPFQCISVDLVGPLPRSRQQNEYLLVVVCCFTKYCLLFPLRRATSKVIADRLENRVFLVHGIPQTIISDNGPQFIGHEVKDLFNRYNVPQVHYTPTYCPQVNTVERYNRTVVTSIATLVGNDHRTWDVNINKIQFAINTSVNEATGFSSFMLVHGREAIPDGIVYGDKEDLDELEIGSRAEYRLKLRELGTIYKMVGESLQKAHSRNVTYYNQHRKDAEYEVGDLVWRRVYKKSDASKFFAAKLAPKFERCRVVEKLSRLVYLLEDENGRTSECHIKDIKCAA